MIVYINNKNIEHYYLKNKTHYSFHSLCFKYFPIIHIGVIIIFIGNTSEFFAT